MTPRSRVFCACLILLSTTARAQTPPDVAALARTVQKLTQRVDRLQKEVDQLKAGKPPAATAAAADPTAPPVKRSAGQTVPVKGWLVEVIPADNDAKDALASFSWDKSELNFGLHTQQISGHNPYIYRGVAKFYPDQKARYVFQLTLDPVKTNSGYFFRCAGNLKIGSDVVVEGKASALNAYGNFDRNGEIFVPATFSGGAELEPPPDPSKGYVLTFEVSCFTDEQDHAQLQDMLFKPWQDNRFSILVKGPDDGSARPFAGDELYHAGKVKVGR